MKARWIDIYNQYKQAGFMYDDISIFMTEIENETVKELWKTMPGYTCYMDAFLRLLNGKDKCNDLP